jgi:phospholipase D1/2
MTSAAPRSPRVADAAPIVQPGRNCWRLAHASRVALLVDGQQYFAAFRAALARAVDAVLIVGWDFNSGVRLAPDADDGADDRICTVLSEALARRRSLEVYVLDWDFSMIYALEREFLPELRMAWRTPPRFHFRLDGRHPTGGAQHQKIVVVDDAMAFVGGFDFGAGRWDTSDHRPDHPARIDPWGNPYPPLHDVQLAVDGEAAGCLAELVRARWRRATGQRLRGARAGLDPWPPSLRPDLENVEVAIARTLPAFRRAAEVREVETLFLDSIAAARRTIYVENQYLTAASVGAALARRLQERGGPEVVIVLPRQCQGWLEETTMGVLRARLMRRLIAADRHRRLRVYYPDIAGLGDRRLTVHSKVMVIDDRLLRVGSANLNNRSMGLDSECDVAVDGTGDARVRAGIAMLRDRLIAEHLGQAPDRFAAALAAHGSMIAAIEALDRPERGLRRLSGEVEEWLDQMVPNAAIIDPERPIAADALLAQLVPGQFELRTSARAVWPLVLVAIVSAALLIALV